MRHLRTSVIASGLYFAAAWAGSSVCAAQAGGDPQKVLQERIEKLASSLEAAQSQVDSMRKEIDALRRDLNAAKTEKSTAAREVVPTGPREEELSRVKEDQEVLAAQVKQHEQTKVESESKYPLRVTGLVVFNAFVNQGAVDEVDVPTSALRRQAGASHGSVGGS